MTCVFNFILAGLLWAAKGVKFSEAVNVYCLLSGFFTPVAAIIIMQDAVVGEKQSGTAAWVLSKPVSRAAFILSKLLPNLLGAVATMVLIPGIVVYAHLWLANGGPLSPLGFLGGLAVLSLNLSFYLALTLMLGTFFDSRGPVISIPLVLVFGQQYIAGLAPFVRSLLPMSLTMVQNGSIESGIASALMLSTPLASTAPVWATLIYTLACVALGLCRFERTEF
jgi:ABC-2 type transport system permease protein